MSDVKLPMVPHCRNYRWKPGHHCKATGGKCEPITQGEAAIRACPSFKAAAMREAEPARASAFAPCVHLGKPTGETVVCKSCNRGPAGDGSRLVVHACAIHGSCVLGDKRPADNTRTCGGCNERQTTALPARPIPRVFHRVWLGNKPMPAEFTEYGRRWLALHPGWEMWTWGDRNITPLRVKECKTWEQSRSHSQRSDVIRFLALLYYGGVYLDTDVEPHKNIEPLLSGHEFVAGREDARFVGTALIASVPGHGILRRAIEELNKGIPKGASGSHTGPPVLTIAARGQKASILSPAAFYPYHWSQPERRTEKFPTAYAVHHWAGSWKGARVTRDG